jgi:hypothetical protein
VEIVERAIDTFVKKNKVTLISGQLISAQYIDQIMEELYELLSD